jgi:hypothetical protein
VRFSPWSYPGRRYLSFVVTGESIEMELSSRVVLYLWAPRNRVASACFAYDLTPDRLRSVVSEMREAGRGLDHWIVPGLEENQASATVQRDHPEKHAMLQELLQASRDLPVAEPWRRRRTELQRLWAKQVREHPEDLAKVPAPWLLPGGVPGRKPRSIVGGPAKPPGTKRSTRK